jgi:hypothetical protein
MERTLNKNTEEAENKNKIKKKEKYEHNKPLRLGIPLKKLETEKDKVVKDKERKGLKILYQAS